ELASGEVSNIVRCEISGLTVKWIGPVDQNLIFPFGKTCKCFGHVVPGHSKKHHFASCSLFLSGSHCSRTKLIDNLSQAIGASAIAKLYLMACLQCPFCERLCESSCSNGADFHTLSFLIWAFQQDDPGFSRTRHMLNCFLKIAKLVLMRDLEKLWVICCETQSELEIFLLFILGQTKPTHNGNALKRDIIRDERINVR